MRGDVKMDKSMYGEEEYCEKNGQLMNKLQGLATMEPDHDNVGDGLTGV